MVIIEKKKSQICERKSIKKKRQKIENIWETEKK